MLPFGKKHKGNYDSGQSKAPLNPLFASLLLTNETSNEQPQNPFMLLSLMFFLYLSSTTKSHSLLQCVVIVLYSHYSK